MSVTVINKRFKKLAIIFYNHNHNKFAIPLDHKTANELGLFNNFYKFFYRK